MRAKSVRLEIFIARRVDVAAAFTTCSGAQAASRLAGLPRMRSSRTGDSMARCRSRLYTYSML